MRKFIKFFCVLGLLFSVCTELSATIQVKKKGIPSSKKISITSFIDYPPFGTKDRQLIDSVYKPLVDLYNEKHPSAMEYYVSDNYNELILKVVDGDIDILLGAYYDTEKYNGIKLIYPSILNNPLVLITMPENSLNIKNKNDLKNLKGAIDSREYFADYVHNELKQYNIQQFDNSEKLYEQLFIGNIDYIITSKYYGAIEQAKLGIRKQVSMSKSTLWDMPLFIGVSGVTHRAKGVENIMKEFLRLNQNTLKKQIEQEIIRKIREADEASIGVVPPAYVK